jgi:hypothetical protein
MPPMVSALKNCWVRVATSCSDIVLARDGPNDGD